MRRRKHVTAYIRGRYSVSRAAHGASRRNADSYEWQGTSRKGHLVALAGATHGRGFVARVQPDEEPWPVEWPDHNNTDRPVVLRRPPHRAVDGAGNEVNRDQGLEAMFGVVHRRGNRVPARARGQAGLFSGEEGAWLRRMWRANAWAQRGGVRGVLASGQGDALHQPVADGFAPPRRGTDGWGAQKWPHEGGHFVNGNGGLSRRVEFSGGVRRTGQAHRPVELQPGCYRAGCPHPHGKDRADDLIHGLPVKGSAPPRRTRAAHQHLARNARDLPESAGCPRRSCLGEFWPRAARPSGAPPPPPSRTNWTRLVPPSVLTGHVSSLLPY